MPQTVYPSAHARRYRDRHACALRVPGRRRGLAGKRTRSSGACSPKPAHGHLQLPPRERAPRRRHMRKQPTNNLHQARISDGANIIDLTLLSQETVPGQEPAGHLGTPWMQLSVGCSHFLGIWME